MRIIGLYGHGECGKSETLNALKELLRETGKSISFKPHPWCEMQGTFEFKGKIICVAPGGDDRKMLQENIRYFKAKRCDVAISTTRCKDDSAEELQKYAKEESVEIEWVQKSYEYNLNKETQTQCNKEIAEVILEMI